MERISQRRWGVFVVLLLAATLVGCGSKTTQNQAGTASSVPPSSTGPLTPDRVRAIAKEAYIYGFPMVDSYRVQHSYFIDSASPEYKGPWNRSAQRCEGLHPG